MRTGDIFTYYYTYLHTCYAVHSRQTLLVASYGLLGFDKIASRLTKWKNNLAVSNTESCFSL